MKAFICLCVAVVLVVQAAGERCRDKDNCDFEHCHSHTHLACSKNICTCLDNISPCPKTSCKSHDDCNGCGCNHKNADHHCVDDVCTCGYELPSNV